MKILIATLTLTLAAAATSMAQYYYVQPNCYQQQEYAREQQAAAYYQEQQYEREQQAAAYYQEQEYRREQLAAARYQQQEYRIAEASRDIDPLLSLNIATYLFRIPEHECADRQARL